MTPAELARHLPRWGLGDGAEITLINVSENMTFRAREGDVARIIRLHRNGYHSDAEIRSELAWIEALRRDRVLDCAEPLPGSDGALIQTVDHAGARRRLVAFAEIAGREPDPGPDLPAAFARLGAITARLHAHAGAWTPPPGFARKRWDVETILGPAPHWGDWRAAPGLDDAGAAVLGRLAKTLETRLARYGAGPQRFGLIHADLRLANLIEDGDRLAVIDFDDCGFGWRMYDFAAAVSFIEDDPRLGDLAARWAEGYRSVAPLAQEDAAVLPALVMLRRLLLTAWIGSRAESDTARALGGPGFTAGTVALADGFLAGGDARFFG